MTGILAVFSIVAHVLTLLVGILSAPQGGAGASPAFAGPTSPRKGS